MTAEDRQQDVPTPSIRATSQELFARSLRRSLESEWGVSSTHYVPFRHVFAWQKVDSTSTFPRSLCPTKSFFEGFSTQYGAPSS